MTSGLMLFERQAVFFWRGLARRVVESRARFRRRARTGRFAGDVLSNDLRRTSVADLRTRFGTLNVVDAPVSLPEGDSEPGTVLYPTDPATPHRDSLGRFLTHSNDRLHGLWCEGCLANP
jgi:hypothetical protein